VIPAAGQAAEFQAQAEQAFRERRYEDAARFATHAIVEDDQNGKLHLFASQTMFALGDFRPAAAAIQLAAGQLDREEWGFVVENYQEFYRGEDYVTHAARLVQFIRDNPDASYARFLLGYHYLFLGHTDAARQQLAKAVELEGRDRLAAELLTRAGGEPPRTAEPTAPDRT
jgi:thioredoxin-like negative regulator of GroEL